MRVGEPGTTYVFDSTMATKVGEYLQDSQGSLALAFQADSTGISSEHLQHDEVPIHEALVTESNAGIRVVVLVE